MNTDRAIDLIHELIFKPNWELSARKFDRDTVVLTAVFPAHNYNREEAPLGYPRAITIGVEQRLGVRDVSSPVELYRKVLDAIMRIDAHEDREALRVKGSFDSPFHPHRLEGMLAYGDFLGDLTFGVI